MLCISHLFQVCFSKFHIPFFKIFGIGLDVLCLKHKSSVVQDGLAHLADGKGLLDWHLSFISPWKDVMLVLRDSKGALWHSVTSGQKQLP